MKGPIVLGRELADALLEHARSSPDTEVCGLIGRAPHGALRRYPVTNVAAAPAERFEMDPREQIDAMRAMREHDETLFAIYHSHPATPPVPSDRDVAELAYPEACQLIVSLADDPPAIRAWRLQDGRMVEVPLEIVD